MMRGLMPWTGMGRVQREMDRLFDRIAEVQREQCPALGDWVPSLDLAESENDLIATLEVPGLERQDIELSLQDGLLTIKGEKRREQQMRYHHVERVYGAFLRSVRLPVPVDATQVTATVKNGLLTVTLLKRSAARGTNIPILGA